MTQLSDIYVRRLRQNLSQVGGIRIIRLPRPAKLYLLIAAMLFPSLCSALPPWPEAVRGNWKEMKTPELVPAFCKPPYSAGRQVSKMFPPFMGLNHFCDYKVKHHICLKYIGKDRNDCIKGTNKGILDAIKGAHLAGPHHPLLPYLYTEYGNSFYEIKEYYKAEQEYRNALRLNKRYLPALIKLSEVSIKQNNFDYAEKLVLYALKITNNHQHKKYLQKKLIQIRSMKQGLNEGRAQ